MAKVKIQKFVLGSLETNCYLVYDEVSKESVIIDPGAGPEILSDALKDLDIKMKYIINTHGHADHIFSNAHLKEIYPDTKLVIHANDESFLSDSSKNLSIFLGYNVTSPAADILIKEGDELSFSGHTFEIIETPGHTMGSICLLLDNQSLFTGDTLFLGSIGCTDFEHSSSSAMANSLKKLKELSQNLTIHPGHGPDSTMGFEVKTNPFI
ncbi:MAG: MBL fold metallo-hydrolase [bacterium]|nr:MBL fold metallo-hydrolase [bacterium]